MPAALAIHRVNARLPADAQPVAARLALQALGADLAEALPRGLPPQSLLWLRRLQLQAPEAALRRVAPVGLRQGWIAAGRQQLDAALAAAARPALGAVAEGAEAVLFADEAEMLACLALAARRGQLDRWWWRGLLGRHWPQWQRAWAERPQAQAAAWRLLGGAGPAGELPEPAPLQAAGRASREARVVRPAAVAAVPASPQQAALQRPAPDADGRSIASATPTSPPAGAAPAPASGGPADAATPADRSLRHLPSVAQQAPGHAGMAAAPPGGPSGTMTAPAAAGLDRSALAQGPVAVSRPPAADQAAPAARTPLAAPAHRAGAAPPPRTAPPAPSQRGATRPRVAPAGMRAAAERPGPAGPPPGLAGPVARGAPVPQARMPPPAALVRPEQPQPDGAAMASAWPWPEALPTRLAPLLFVVNVLLEDGLYPDFTRPLDPGLPVPLGTLLAALAQAWRLPADPLPDALAALAPAGPLPEFMPALPGVPAQPWPGWLAACARLLRRRLCRRLGLRHADWPRVLVLARPATLWRSTADWVVTFDLAAHDLAWRLAGLDRDPGWLPAAGMRLRFTFS